GPAPLRRPARGPRRDDADAAAASGLREQHREATAAGDESDALHGRQRQIPRWELTMKSSSWATSGTSPSSTRTSAMCSRRLPPLWKSRRYARRRERIVVV